MKPLLSLRFDGFDRAGDTVEIAARAEEAGVDRIWMAEHLGYREAAISCTAFLCRTRRVTVFPTAVMPYLWHPTPTAMQFATMDELAPGRVGICVSVGNLMNLQESGVPRPASPVRVMREYVETLRALWAGETVESDGLVWNLRGARLAFRPPGKIPVYIASTGPKVLDLAGRIADGVLFSGGLSRDYTRRCVELAEGGLIASDRNPSSLHKAGFVYFACSRDPASAIESNRHKLAFLFRNSAQAANIGSIDVPIDHDAVMELVRARELEKAAELIPDEAVTQFSVAGTPEQCLAGLQDYIDTGIEEAVIEVTGSDEEQQLALDVIREFSASP